MAAGGRPKGMTTAAAALGIGLNWALALLLGTYGGQALDRRLHTAPAFLIVGLVLGMAAGMAGSIAVARRYLGEKDDSP
jgi:F0F1-type ATP synthase assembly protein I